LIRINLDNKTYGEQVTAINLQNRFPTRIDKKATAALKKTDLSIINKLLCKKEDKLTRLQENILTAILWFGNAVKDEQRNMKFVKSMMALESLLIPDGRTGKCDMIAKRFASITYASGSDLQKTEAFLDMRNMYLLRNSIIHSGKGYVYEDDLQQLMSWARGTIQIILHFAEKLKTLSELIEKKYPVNEALYEKL
jgi:hypothetical protein